MKILSGDNEVKNTNSISDDIFNKATSARKSLEKKYDDDFESIIADQRYKWINSIIKKVIVVKRKEKISTSDKIDRILTNKFLGLPIFFLIIYGIYFICLNPSGLGKRLVGITFGWVGNIMEWTATSLTNLNVAPWLVSMVSDGIVFGVGLVIAFIPYLMVLFACLAILEECGYMSRVAFIMDRLFRRFGLSGKSFIPMLLGTGCSVQAIASSRTIENEADRKMTIFLTPFMPCATKMPVIILIVGLFTSSSLIAPIMYLIAIGFIILGIMYGENIAGALSGLLSTAGAVGFLIFFMFSSPCFASISAMKRELSSSKLTIKAIGFQMGTAYVSALVIYQLLNLIL